jgi:ATP-binding cassette subfamily F protein uup
VDEYLELRHNATNISTSVQKEKKSSNAAEERQLKKDKVRLERQMEKADSKISELENELEAAAFDPARLQILTGDLENLRLEKAKLEEAWLQVTLSLED